MPNWPRIGDIGGLESQNVQSCSPKQQPFNFF